MTIAISAAYGLLIGSFLTVVVDRVPRGASIVSPGSACGNCGLRLGFRDLVPVLSWLALRGKCRRCRTNIGKEALVLELLTGLLFGLFAWKFGLDWALPAYCVFGGGLLGLSVIDLHTKRLPREIIYITAAIGIPLLCLAAIVRHEPRRMWMMLLGAGIALAFMALVYVGSRGGMGDGDVRLSPLLGAYLGWINPGIVAVGLFLGFFAGAAVGVAMMASGRAGRKTAVPFGPFLALGTIVAVFVGQRCVDIFMRR
ncbi:MAG: leader peptidase (prepilin peptidase) / N-methyltransferase [Ilumatobacteraceae bacterium]|jgi:leader peptidase (prepilin peptidase)/N-methyltransferase